MKGVWMRALALLVMLSLMSCSSADDRPISAELRTLRNSLPVQKGLNVIVISFDALRPDVLGIYGNDRGISPNIDAFGEKSLVFERAYAAAPVTPTSFAAAFSGMLPVRVFHAWDFVAEDTLAKRFSEAGYKTLGFINSVQLTPERHFDRGFDVYDWRRNDPDDQFVDRVTAGLLDHRKDQPLFSWIHFLLPHAPYEYREIAKAFYSEGYEGPFKESTGVRFEAESPGDAQRVRELYHGQVYFTDIIFGRLIQRLEALGYLDSSIIVLTADHGEEFQDHGGFQHGSKLFEEALRIPLIIYHPSASGGQRTDVLYSNVDLMPTLLGATGHSIDSPIDGRNLLEISRDRELAIGIAMTGRDEHNISLRIGSKKLILYCLPEEKTELYDLGVDAGELRNTVAEEPDITEDLKSKLGRILGGNPCQVVRAGTRGELQTRGLDNESIEALKALGYL